MKRRTPAKIPIILNVYDLSPYNDYGHQWGVGFYHSGVQVGDAKGGPSNFKFLFSFYYFLKKEYSFGGHDFNATGIYEIEPRSATGIRFREAIYMGDTELSLSQIEVLISELSPQFMGKTYNILSKFKNSYNYFIYLLSIFK